MFLRIWFLLRYWLCWILFFEVARIAFLLKNVTSAKDAGLSASFQSLWYGARMDASLAAYFTIPLALCMIVLVFTKLGKCPIFIKIYTGLLLLVCLLLILIDLNLFQAWGYRVDASILKYMSNPKEVYATIAYLPLFWILLFFVIIYLLLLFVFNKLLSSWYKSMLAANERKAISIILILLLTGLFIIPIRGGLQLAPLNQSSVYFSQNNFANLAAINAPWNFLYSINHNIESSKNPFVYLSDTTAHAIVDSLYSQHPDKALPQSKKTNVIIIVWESFTEKATHLTVQGHEITPGFNALKKEGIYFSNIYASGNRTDKGIVAVLSGYPAQPITSIVKEPGKAAKLPKLSTQFSNDGYHTAFYYGGELEFANIKAYLLGGSFNHFVSINDFDKKDQNSKWGAHDGVVMERLLAGIQQQPQPFFYTWLTLSSHEPFETPVPTVIQGKDVTSLFLNTLHYTDAVLYQFIAEAKKQPWWQNTIVAIVADHGHPLPITGKRIDNYKIPLLFLGGGLPASGITIDKIGSQIDLPATLLAQLQMPYTQYKWSKNIMDSTVKPWAYFSFNNGFGFVEPGKSYLFDNVGKSYIEKQGPVLNTDLNRGKALEQLSFQDYLNK